MSDDTPDVYIPGGEAPNVHPASGGGPYDIPDVSGETAEIAEDMDYHRAQNDFDKEKH